MLTEKQRIAIELEESYRYAIRKKLTQTEEHSRCKSLWSALNSPFVLFLLSSVLLAGITALGSRSYTHYQEQKIAIKLESKLYADAAYRIAKLDIAVKHYLSKYKGNVDSKKTLLDVIDIYRVFE